MTVRPLPPWRPVPHGLLPLRLSLSLRSLAVAVVVGWGAGCVTSTQPLFPDDVGAALARSPMRRMETAHLRLYYPAARREQAYRSAARIESCVTALKDASQVHNGTADRRMTLILPELTFNNAFASPPISGYEPVAVVPTYDTIDAFSLEMGLPPDPVATACHELTHYVHFQQIAGFSRIVNLVFGESYSPQLGFDAWFDEGLAVHYETLLQPGIGRLAWPFWHGVFAAGVAGRRLDGGDLSAFNRDFYMGNQYLVGSHFVRFLAERYGEYFLWKVIHVQARSIFFPLWVNVRFWQAYDKSLSTLIDEFAADVARRTPMAQRPPEQRVVSAVGTSARYGRAPDGSEALLLSDQELPPRLLVRGPSGQVRLELSLVDVVPPRRLTVGQPLVSSSPSFTADGKLVYFAALDQGATFQVTRLVRVEVASGRTSIAHPDLRGGGGSVSPDGRHYVFSLSNGDRHDLAELDIESGVIRVLAPSPAGSFVSLPRYAPDGKRLVATVYDRDGFSIRIFDATTGALLSRLTDGKTPVHDASWAGNDAIVFLSAERAGEGFQVHLIDLPSKVSRRLTRAPYLAFEPQVAQGTLRFLNREGRQWTLDEVPMAAPVKVAVAVAFRPVFAATSPSAMPMNRERAAGDGGRKWASLIPTPGLASPSPSPPPPSPPSTPPVSPVPTAPPAPNAAARSPGAAENPAVPPPAAVVPRFPSSPPAETQLPPPAAGSPPPWGTVASPPPPPFVWPAPPPPPPAPPPPLVLSDAPYDSTDHLFAPSLHGVDVVSLGRRALAVGAVLAGNDRLQFHRWMVRGVYQFSSAHAGYGVGFGYSNRQLAPVRLSLSGLWLNLRDTPPALPGAPAPRPADFTLDKRQRQANVEISRAFYDNPVTVGFNLTADDEPLEPTVRVASRYVAGPYVAATFAGVESTAYSGVRRLLFASVDAAMFPGSWNSAGATLTDLRGELAFALPLPFSRRHSFILGGTGRAITGLAASQPWLQVGGGGAATLFSRRSTDDLPPRAVTPDGLPPDVRFFEPLRGYEDFPLATDRVVIGRASYRFPFIIDWGSASTFGVLPAFFLRELAFSPFGTVAKDGQSRRHTAAGASLAARFAFGQVPLSLGYQLARRFDDDRAFVHLITLAAQ